VSRASANGCGLQIVIAAGRRAIARAMSSSACCFLRRLSVPGLCGCPIGVGNASARAANARGARRRLRESVTTSTATCTSSRNLVGEVTCEVVDRLLESIVDLATRSA
jgi:hypothetical protein